MSDHRLNAVWFWAIAASVMVAFTSFDLAAREDAELATVVVHVSREGESGRQISVGDATVSLWRGRQRVLSARTDARGIAQLDSLSPGDVTLSVEASGFVTEWRPASLEPGERLVLRFDLAAGSPIDGIVVDSASNYPVANASITIVRGTGDAPAAEDSFLAYGHAVSNAEGRFHVNTIPSGRSLRMRALAPGYAPAFAHLGSRDDVPQSSPVVIRLSPGRRVTGRVRDAAEAPIPGATVYVLPASALDLRERILDGTDVSDLSDLLGCALTDSDGRFALAGLTEEELFAVARADGFSPAEQVVLASTTPGGPGIAELSLARPGILVVRVFGPEGSPLGELASVAVGDSPTTSRRKQAPDEANAYRFDGLEAGEWTVKVESRSFATSWTRVAVRAGAESELSIHLRSGKSVSGVVVDEAGRPIAGMSVEAREVGVRQSEPSGWVEIPISGRVARSDQDGRFVVRGLDSSEAEVEAWSGASDSPGQYATFAPVRVRLPAAGLRLVAVPLGAVALHIVGPDGEPFSGQGMLWLSKAGADIHSGVEHQICDGSLLLQALRNGEYAMQLDVRGFVSLRQTFSARIGQRVDLGTMRLLTGVPLRGRVIDGFGDPVAGAQVFTGDRATTASEYGEFVLGHLGLGVHSIDVEADGYLGTRVEVTLSVESRPVEVHMERGALVSGRVVDSRGSPLQEDVFIWPLGPDGSRVGHEEAAVWPDEDGYFEQRLKPGRYRFVTFAEEQDGHPVTLDEMVITEGETRRLTLKIRSR